MQSRFAFNCLPVTIGTIIATACLGGAQQRPDQRAEPRPDERGPVWRRVLEEKTPPGTRMSSALHQIGRFQKGADREQVQKMIRRKGLAHRADGKIQVEIVMNGDPKPEIDPDLLRDLGLEINLVRGNRADGWLKAADLIPFSAKLGNDYQVSGVTKETTNDEGPALVKSLGYQVGGGDGTGIKVAIIDSGFTGLAAVSNSGTAPGAYTAIDFTGNGLEANDNIHGTACVEAVYDHAPGATYFIYRTSGGTQFAAAVDDAIANDVDVITCSLGPHNTGWDDNSGVYCEAVVAALDEGMLFFTTAGNEALKHWQGDFSDPDADDWHHWSGADEKNFITVAANNADGDNDNSKVAVSLQWDGSPDNDDYDLYLFDSNDQLLDSSIAASGFEYLSWTNESEDPVDVYIAIHHYDGNTPEFEIFVEKQPLTYAVAASSIECPTNVTHANAISVGAVHRNDYNEPPGADVLTSYSSHGPTNSGNQAPDICAPTSTTTLITEGGFSGTSCSAPNAAGATVAFWSEHPHLSATGVRQILFRLASMNKDWGNPGVDYQYGYGGLVLDDFLPESHYVYRSANNLAGTADRAYYDLEQADAAVPAGANVKILGQTYPVPQAGVRLSHPATYRSLRLDAVVE
ncbi:peptidase S8 and S53 subtilisin/kexin/sedolisin [Haloferula helveola]|uniref:Peptidase S8 and S53 subtilisin/kexin/sedolisin n=1 Tax=Haloferula helveola TaxID=490095 RepID=A0ABM7RKF1_9BACT|nr:peptidase S8 and S53 subtilisin/kexin/sedolisin [Haloferula helveola]